MPEKSPAKNRAAVYARVSKRDQKPENQILELRQYARAHGLEIVEEFVDHGESGAKVFYNPKSAQRRLRDEVQKGNFCRFGTVLVWKFDRFARNVFELLKALREFDQAGIRFISLNEQIDTGTVHGRLVFTILGAVAEMELGMMKERIYAGLDRARMEGKVLGRPPVLDAKQTAQAVELRAQGHSWSELARYFGRSMWAVRRAVLASLAKSPPKSPPVTR